MKAFCFFIDDRMYVLVLLSPYTNTEFVMQPVVLFHAGELL